MPRRPHARRVRVQHDQRGDEWPPIADDRDLSDERVALQQPLHVGRRHVLAAGGNDQLLLAVDDAHVALGIDARDVARVKPAVGVDRVRGAVGVLVVALHHVAAAQQQLAVLGHLELEPGVRLAHRPDPLVPDLIHGRAHGRFGHAVALDQRQAEGAEELDDTRRDRRRARDAQPACVQADSREQCAVLDVRVGGKHRLKACLQLLPHPRRANHDRRMHLGGVLEHLLDVGAEVHVCAAHDRVPVPGVALEGVCQRQIRQVALLRAGFGQSRVAGLCHPQHLAVRVHDALGRSRGT